MCFHTPTQPPPSPVCPVPSVPQSPFLPPPILCLLIWPHGQCAVKNANSPPYPWLAALTLSLSLCLACHGFLAAQLFPTWVMLNSNKSSTLAPAGNRRRRTSSGRSVIQMHGVKNIVQCFLGIFWVKSGMSVVDSPAACLQRYTLTAQLAEIMGCMKGERGNKLMHHNTQLLEALKPPHKYMPEILLDGEDMDALQDKGLSPAIPKTESLICLVNNTCSVCP
uniref:Uncharacterized protein n=1 Tax=Gopherus agassizii TaxID=38772 RepID=A0A452J4C3_9SAUR